MYILYNKMDIITEISPTESESWWTESNWINSLWITIVLNQVICIDSQPYLFKMWINRRDSTNILQSLSACHPSSNNSIIQYRVSTDDVFLQYCLYFCISENGGIFCICVMCLWQWGCIKWICIQCLWQWWHILPFHNLVLKPNVIITCIMVWFVFQYSKAIYI